MVATTLRRTGLLALTAAALGGSFAFGAGTASAATPFDCTGQVFLGQRVNLSSAQFFAGSFGSGNISFTKVGAPAQVDYNAIGFNTKDNYVYGIGGSQSAPNLVRIDSTGAVTTLPTPAGLPSVLTLTDGNRNGWNVGVFDDQGYLYIASSAHPALFVIDVAANRLVRTVNLTAPPNTGDITYAAGYFWGGLADGSVSRINPTTGVTDVFPGAMPAGGYGGAFTYGNGDLGFYANAGVLNRVAVANPGSASPTFTFISSQTGPSSSANDATSCAAPATDLSIVKAGPAQVEQGGTVSYTLTVRNNGAGASSGYTVTDQIPAGLTNVTTGSPGCKVTGSTLTCTGGALAVGDVAFIEVSGTADGTVRTLQNAATVRGNEQDPNPVNDTSNTVVTEVNVPLVSAAVGAGALGLFGGGWALRRRTRRATA
ncbi:MULTISPECIES: DUF11 domain-containing protein [Amycolatopsis]|uniref:DUF11 domain-containing protein n=1 Tax=Amycolatopsis dongchuanensis TaxID=1070866 RepID=A0ABP8VJM9_9PSEU